MPDIEQNKLIWTDYNWDKMGNEWSEMWGGTEILWYAEILPRIKNFINATNIVEIGCGFGRITQFLLSHCKTYQGYDVIQKCIDYCKEKFNNNFFLSNGQSLSNTSSNSVDFLFSYDSLVHSELDAIEPYIKEILRVLNNKGVAFIHHSNYKELINCPINMGMRGIVSGNDVINLIKQNNGSTILQEKLCWNDNQWYTDAFTLFQKNNLEITPEIVCNSDLVKHQEYCKKYFNLWK